jgi:hypothetical protein
LYSLQSIKSHHLSTQRHPIDSLEVSLYIVILPLFISIHQSLPLIRYSTQHSLTTKHTERESKRWRINLSKIQNK